MKKRYKTFRQITITCGMSDSHKALDYCYSHGYRTMVSGPRRISLTQVDIKTFQVTAHKEIKMKRGKNIEN